MEVENILYGLDINQFKDLMDVGRFQPKSVKNKNQQRTFSDMHFNNLVSSAVFSA
jgi:hypothetical protein